MANILRMLNIEGEIICVDTWLGSAEHILPHARSHASMRYKNGYPQPYYTFLANVLGSDVQDYITPFATTLETAYYIFKKKLGVEASLIYLDASHEFPSVVRDILAVWQLLSETGVLLGDDYDWKEVREAVRVAKGRLEQEQRCFLYTSGTKYILSRRPLPADVLQSKPAEVEPRS